MRDEIFVRKQSMIHSVKSDEVQQKTGPTDAGLYNKRYDASCFDAVFS